MAEYNPLNHSIVQACVGAWSRYECDDFIEALLDAILDEMSRVHWNVYQHQWGPTWHADEVEDPMIDGIGFVRYYQDRCDCGGLFPIHTEQCVFRRLHPEWNRRRLKFLTDDEGYISFSQEKESDFAAKDPRPVCDCGGDEAFDEDRGCLPTCIGQRPNFQFEDVEIRWYKRPGRGMSTNKEWTSDEWRAWFDRCLACVRSFEGDYLDETSDQRNEQRRLALKLKYPKAFAGEQA